MEITILPDPVQCGHAAAVFGASLLRETIAERGEANLVVATGASQFEMIEALVRQPDVAWDRVTAFHLDEYVGIPVSHPASFRRYLWERFHRKLPLPLKAFHYIGGDGDPRQECLRLGELIRGRLLDVCFAGIGENGHLAFNDPPADFETDEPYLVVSLDEKCRRQQFNEGWFPSINLVPQQAISMSINCIIKSRAIIITVPDERKARAVRDSIEGPVSNKVPASILQKHSCTNVFLDAASSALLSSLPVTHSK